MDLTDKTRIVIAILCGEDPDKLARDHGLHRATLDGWTQTFLEAGIGALGDLDTPAGPLAKVIPFPAA